MMAGCGRKRDMIAPGRSTAEQPPVLRSGLKAQAGDPTMVLGMIQQGGPDGTIDV